MNPQMLETAIRSAHIATGAPGDVLEIRCGGTYLVACQYGRRVYRYSVNGDRVTVRCNWTVAGDRQRRQATRKLGVQP